MKRILYIIVLLLLVVIACKKDGDTPINVPTINDQLQVQSTSATISGTIDCSVAIVKLEMYVYANQDSRNPDMYEVELIGGKSFEITLVDLQPATIYNYRYVVYSDVDMARLGGKKFKTLNASIPTVETLDVDTVGVIFALCGGNVLYDGGYPVTERGVCWSTYRDPIILDNCTVDSCGEGMYVSQINGLRKSTTYYVRAYATNQKGTAYGEQKVITTTDGLPKVTTSEVTEITNSSAICGGKVLSSGGSEVVAYGVCWSRHTNPTISDRKTNDGAGLGEFTSNISNLTKNITYYVRAYATNENGTAYGEERQFTAGNIICGHEYVDLGLPSGLKWATCNVGANNSYEYGNYYAWGEITTKLIYADTNSVTYGEEMTDISGNPSYDAATANWGCSWRMPTETEARELITICDWTWVEKTIDTNLVTGYLVTGPNGNSIFLPLSGCYTLTHYSNVYTYMEGGCFWTSSSDNIYDARIVSLHSIYETMLGTISHVNCESYMSRASGLTIRPVSN